MRKTVFIVCLIFGGLMVASFAPAQAEDVAVEGVYCRFDVKKWEGSILKYLQKGSDCTVKVKTEWGSFEYDQPVVPDPDAFDFTAIWAAIRND